VLQSGGICELGLPFFLKKKLCPSCVEILMLDTNL
jgi:hypothetical protein